MIAAAIEIRLARPDDAAALLALICAHASFEGATASITQAELAGMLAAETPPTHIMVAALGDELLGYAAITRDFSLWRARHWAHLDCLFVAEAVRGQAIGTRLLDTALAHARGIEADRIEWQTPLSNKPAIAFYRHYGACGAPKMRFALPLASEQ